MSKSSLIDCHVLTPDTMPNKSYNGYLSSMSDNKCISNNMKASVVRVHSEKTNQVIMSKNTVMLLSCTVLILSIVLLCTGGLLWVFEPDCLGKFNHRILEVRSKNNLSTRYISMV